TQWVGRTRPAATAAQAGEVDERAAAENEAATRTAGDILAVAAVAVTGLGLVRSFTAAAMVVGRPYSWAFMAAVAIGFAVAALPWIVARGWVENYSRRFDQTYNSTGWNRSMAGLKRTGKEHQGNGGTQSPRRPLALFAIPFIVAAAGAVPVRADSSPTLTSSLRQWLADPLTASCAVPAPSTAGAARVEPLVLVATAGGGIRDAW